MASIIAAMGVIGVGVYAIQTNNKVYNEIKNTGDSTKSTVNMGGFTFTRPPKYDLFSDLDGLKLDPTMPIGKGGVLPFTESIEKNGIFGIKKILLKTQNNTLYTVYAGRESALDV